MLDVLEQLAKPGAQAAFLPGLGNFRPNGYWCLSTGGRGCAAQVEALIRRGLLSRISTSKYDASAKAIITKSGRAALKAWPQ